MFDIPLNDIENDQRLFKNNVKPKPEKDIFYADIESIVSGVENHTGFLIGVIKQGYKDVSIFQKSKPNSDKWIHNFLQ